MSAIDEYRSGRMNRTVENGTVVGTSLVDAIIAEAENDMMTIVDFATKHMEQPFEFFNDLEKYFGRLRFEKLIG